MIWGRAAAVVTVTTVGAHTAAVAEEAPPSGPAA